MFETTSTSGLWWIFGIQGFGVIAAFAAHRSSGTVLQSFCHAAALVSMAVAGTTALLGSESGPARCLVCGTLFACMVLTATFDRCGLGLRPNSPIE